MKFALDGQLVAPVATFGPSHHWVRSADHSSLPVPIPLNMFCAAGAPLSGSPVKLVMPLVVLAVPHWVP